MKIYTVLEVRYERNREPYVRDASSLDGWSVSCSSLDKALEEFKSMVRRAVSDFYDRHQESYHAEEVIPRITDGVCNKDEAFANWTNVDEFYVWKISSEYVDNQTDPLPPRSENKDEPVEPKEAKIGSRPKDEGKQLELVRYAVVRTKLGHRWMSPYPAGEILFTAETEEKAWKLLKETYDYCLLKYPEMQGSDHYASEQGGYAYAGDPKTCGMELHIQRLPMPLTDKEIEDVKDNWNRNFVTFKDLEEQQNGGDKVRE